MLYFVYSNYSRLSMWFYALAEQYMGLLIFKTAHRLLFSNKLLVFLLQIYPDPELEQQILALPIRCIHSEEGCRWTGQMKQLQVRSFHIRSNLICVSSVSNTLGHPPSPTPLVFLAAIWLHAQHVGGCL